MFEWDEAKRQANLAKHGVDFADVERFEWELATERMDDRRSYGEVRVESTSFIGHRLHVLVYTSRGAKFRIISLRKANGREVLKWNT